MRGHVGRLVFAWIFRQVRVGGKMLCPVWERMFHSLGQRRKCGAGATKGEPETLPATHVSAAAPHSLRRLHADPEYVFAWRLPWGQIATAGLD